uniref:Glycerol-3-phosphate dehydrogenase n=1 Tax=Cacopsylla melanoneura TaxID=428564 RepID=A0A8D8T4K7_9HEMI
MATNRLRKIVIGGTAFGVGAFATKWLMSEDGPLGVKPVFAAEASPLRAKRPLPPREEQIKALTAGEEFDVLIIGGGATGSGCALDAVTRGLKTALVEFDDFASGTSSRSTKLIHGGVRYLQKAIMNLDIEQYRMVKEALHERSSMLFSAPHLTHPLPIMLPVYTWWQIPYYWLETYL